MLVVAVLLASSASDAGRRRIGSPEAAANVGAADSGAARSRIAAVGAILQGDANSSRFRGTNGKPMAAYGAVLAVAAHDWRPGAARRSVSGLRGDVSTEPARDCSPRDPDGFVVSDLSPAVASIEISQALYGCAHEAGLAPAEDPSAIAALVTRGVRGPLLLTDPGSDAEVVDELRRLGPELVVLAGLDDHAVRHRLSGLEIEQAAVDEAAVEETAVAAPGRASFGRVWLVDDPEWTEALAAVARQIEVGVVPVAGDLRALPPPARETIAGASEVELLSELGEDALWQLDVVRRGDELPGGGLLMFEPDAAGPGRRLVAMYGHPSTSVLGVMGEQSPPKGIERLRAIAEGYGADGSTVVPTFEVIVTVASAAAGSDGDYSNVTANDVIRPWVEEAAASGAYVVLDLQPGRSDFLSQAKIYEEFLRQPHVGLALDPEWRLKPHQVHLVQVGTVDAAEINQVVHWLADIVRQEALPQKLLVLHQFRSSMITNRDQIQTPPELAVLIHMDGQGPPVAKHSTWSFLTQQLDADRFYWGWKNFYDEDVPQTTPDQVLELSPRAVFVSYQ